MTVTTATMTETTAAGLPIRLSPAAMRGFPDRVVREAVLPDEFSSPVDADIADAIVRVNALGLRTIASDSGTRRDHPSDVFPDEAERTGGRWSHSNSTGYLAIVTSDAGTQALIRDAAAAAGICADTKGETAYFQPGVTVGMPHTGDGLSHERLVAMSNAAATDQIGYYQDPDGPTFDDWLELRDDLQRNLVAEHGGRFSDTDEGIVHRWTRFAEELEARMAPALLA